MSGQNVKSSLESSVEYKPVWEFKIVETSDPREMEVGLANEAAQGFEVVSFTAQTVVSPDPKAIAMVDFYIALLRRQRQAGVPFDAKQHQRDADGKK